MEFRDVTSADHKSQGDGDSDTGVSNAGTEGDDGDGVPGDWVADSRLRQTKKRFKKHRDIDIGGYYPAEG